MTPKQKLWLKTAVDLIQDRLEENESTDGDIIALEGSRDLVELVLEDVDSVDKSENQDFKGEP